MDAATLSPHQGSVFSKSELLALADEAASSRAEIARLLNVAPARISELYKGTRDLSFDEAVKLINHYGLDGATPPANELSIESFAFDHGLAMVEEVDLALGMGTSFLDYQPESKGLVPFKKDWLAGLFSGPLDNLKVVRGQGDSMEPTIRSGDFVLVDTSQKRINDQDVVWAVAYGELGMIRRVRSIPGGGYLLMPDNSVVRPIEAHDGEMAVLGKVIWIGRRM